MAIEQHDWQRNWKMETKVAKIIESCSSYFNDLKASYGKQILSSEQNSRIHNIVNSLRLNIRTRRFFDRENQASMPSNIEFYYQLPIYFEYEGIQCKALLDLVVVVRDEEGIITDIFPYDLKTMAGNTKYFLFSFIISNNKVLKLFPNIFCLNLIKGGNWQNSYLYRRKQNEQ